MAFTVVCGRTRLSLENSTDNYPIYLVHNNKNYVDNAASINGCVVLMSGNGINSFVGGAHGYATLLGSSIILDGSAIQVANNGSYTGTNAIITRSVNYASGAILDHVITMSDGKIDDNFTFTSIMSGMYISTFYACLSSRANRLTEYSVYAPNGVLVASGTTTADDDSFTTQYVNINRVRQRNQASGDYIDTTYRYDERNALWYNFLWDRAADNKNYNRAYGYEGFLGSKKMAWSQSIRFSP